MAFLSSGTRNNPCAYIIAVALVALALLVRLAIAPVSAGLQYVTFFPAVALSAIVGGYRTGLLATAIGLVLATYIFTPPYYSISFEVLRLSFWSNLVFLIDGIIVSYAIEAMHRYRRRYQNELAESRNSEARLTSLNKELGAAIAERKQIEEQLHIAAAAFETNEAILVTDADARIVRVNRAFEKITGYSQSEVLGQNPRILNSGRHDPAFYAEMWQTIQSTGTWNGEMWDRHKNGGLYPKEMTISAIKNEQGETVQYVAIFTDISERKRTEAEIHSMAFYDALTRLPNRRLLLDRLSHAISVSERSKRYGALLFVDIDNFKTLNDTLGHDYGDLLLIEIAKRLKFCIREMDTVARFGGDEFVVLLENVGDKAAEAPQLVAQIAEKIRSVLATSYQLNQNQHHSSPSIGVCLYSGADVPAEELIKRADMAMYQAKISGRNRVRFFDPKMQQMAQSRAALEVDLRQAIPNRQLQLHYQIQLDHDQQPTGAEALIRWLHPKRGLVPPGQFIPVAEESTMVFEIGNWVLDTACQQLAEWSQGELTRHLILAINVSAQQFGQPDFVEQIERAIEKFRIDPSRLKLELTESVALHDLDSVIEKMRSLRESVGVSLSLDDFGTGYSSLSYLKRLPIDQVKIDQSFVRDITTDANDAVMVKTIIDLAKNFSLQVIAEGVETQAQFDFLRENGCLAFQGYLFSKPLPLKEFEALLAQRKAPPAPAT